MKQNKLLQRQMHKLLPEQWRNHPDLQPFFEAVYSSYSAFERDNEIANRAFRLSEEEYVDVNEQLKTALELKKFSIQHLKETLNEMGDASLDLNSDELPEILNYLKHQIAKRKEAEQELTTVANRLSSIISSMQVGILVEDENRRMALTNEFFCSLFNIPAPPHTLTGIDCAAAAEQTKELFADPVHFIERINDLLTRKEAAVNDELALVDGRVFERDYIPIFINNQYKGHLWNYRDVTFRKRAQQELEVSEMKNRLIMNGALDAIITMGNDGCISFWNPQAERIFGWKAEEVLGKKLADTIIPPYMREHHEKGMQRYRENGQHSVLNKLLELPAVSKSGREFPIELSIIPINQNGKEFFCSFIRDIAERKKTEEELKRLSLVASVNQNGVVFTSPDGKIFWSNEGFCKLTGYSYHELDGKTPIELCRGDLTDKTVLRRMIHHFENGEVFDVELLFYRKEGSCFWGRTTGQPIYNEKGKLVQFFSMIEDISADKEREKQIERLSMVARSNSKGIMLLNENEEVEWINSSYELITGYSLKDLKGKNPIAFVMGERTDKAVAAEMKKRADQGLGFSEEFIHYRKDGTSFWSKTDMQFVEGRQGDIVQRFIVVEDITERKLADQALQIREEKYRNIIANMNLGLLEVDMQENIQFANQRFCEMCGFELDEIIGKKASTLFTRGENHELIEAKNDLRRKGQSDVYELAIKNKRGEMKWWLISGAPHFNDDGELVGSIGIHLDITEQKNLEIKLYEAREEAEKSAEAKKVFLANMSHEIRTPMNAILGMGRQLEKTVLNQQQKLFLSTMNAAADNLLVIINDILDISKIEAGKLDIEQIGFRLYDVLQHTKEVVKHRADEKGLALQFSFDETIAPVLIGDPYRLNQILLNLLSNAIKFTEKGKVRISCCVTESASQHQTVLLVVEDTGVGMDEKYLLSLFEKFSQEDKTTARQHGGTGLGMAITKNLVELMSGQIEVRSSKGHGTQVSLSIPFKVGSEADLKTKQSGAFDSSLLAFKKILLVEDNEMNRFVAKSVLSPYKMQVTEAENGAEAVALLEQQTFDLVLMDVQMPVMNGLEATSVIRKKLNLSVPIIALTANAIKGENEHCFELGMNAYVTKPFEEKVLIQSIIDCLCLQPSGIEKELQTADDAQKDPALYSLNKLYELGRNDKQFLRRMITMFISSVETSSLEMQSALDKNDLKSLGETAHRLKPMVDTLQILSIKEPIRVLEKVALNESESDVIRESLEFVTQQLKLVCEKLKLESWD